MNRCVAIFGLGIATGLFGGMPSSEVTQLPFDDINSFLGNSPRTDLIGPEMWTLSARHAADEGDYKPFIGGQMPFHSWSPPSLGLHGCLCLTHMTEFQDLIQIGISECGTKGKVALQFVPTRNLWTPSKLTTYYRSAPNALGTDFPKSGNCSLKETKCITGDNVFVAELEICNRSPEPRTYALSLQTVLDGMLAKNVAAGRTSLTGLFEFTTETMCKRTPRTGFAALVVTTPGLTWETTLQPWKRQTLRYAFCFSGFSSDNALSQTAAALDDQAVFDKNVARFNQWFRDNVPVFRCGNFDVLKMYYYRWFVVYRGIHETRRLIPGHEYPRQVMYESPQGEWYDCVIGLPVPMQINESSWLRTPQIGWDHILNWSEEVKGYRGYIQFTPMAIWNFYKHHPDKERLTRSFDSIQAFSPITDKLPSQCGSWWTGAEYQPNFYQFTTPSWDYRNDSELCKSATNLHIASVVRLDTAGYAIGNLLATARFAGVLGRTSDEKKWKNAADRLLDIIKTKHWDPKTELFLAADPVTGKLADQAACYDSFVPYMWGMVSEPKYLKAFDKLLDDAWFWDDFPVTTVAKTCPMFFDNNAIVGPTEASLTHSHYYGCSWNGPVWNYANSLVAEAFGQGAVRRTELRRRWLVFFTRWSEMQYLYGDRSTPYATEHNRSADGARHGTPSEYFHSSWLDPFLSYWCGIRLENDQKTLTFDPFTAEDFSVARVPLAGKEYTFVQTTDASGNHDRAVYNDKGCELCRQKGDRSLTVHLQ